MTKLFQLATSNLLIDIPCQLAVNNYSLPIANAPLLANRQSPIVTGFWL